MNTKKSNISTSLLAAFSGAAALVLAGYGISNATVISQTFATSSGDEGGVVTFTDSASDATLAANQLKITFDNTTNGPTFSTAITGIVFNIDADINAVSSFSFVDGSSTNLASLWTVSIDIGSSISNNTVFDITFASGNINGGIYNAADPGGNLDNVFPDIATLILTISDPNPYAMTSVGSDSILRMQRAGTTGEDSLKLVTSTSSTSGGTTTSTSGGTTTSTSGGTTTSSNGNVPEPGMVSLLGIGLLGQAFLLRQRRRRLQK